MRDYDRQQPLIAIHVPKSAGTSVRSVFRSWFGRGFREHYFDELEGQMPKRHDIEQIHSVENPIVVYGHFNRLRKFGIEDYYPDAQQFVTILRDPFELAVSNYFYTRKVGGNWKDRSRVPDKQLSDHVLGEKPNMLNHFPREVTSSNYKDIIEEFFIDIGITEQLSHSIERLAGKLGMPFEPDVLEHLNATRRSEDVPPGLRELFIEKFDLEYVVYDYAARKISYADS